MSTILLALGIAATSAAAQTYKSNFGTKLVLAGGGSSLANTTTLQASNAGSVTYTFPSSGVTNGYLLTTDASGNLSWTNPTAIGVSGIVGTANQVLANNTSGSTQTGVVTLTLPQSINTGASPTFAGLTLSGLTAQPGVVHNSNAGVLSSSGIVTADIVNANVTYAKLQNEAASTILGNPTGAGAAPSEITLDPTLKFTGTTVALDVTHANTWTGTQSFGGVVVTQAADVNLAAGTTNDLGLAATNSYFRLTATAGAATITSIANPSPGRTAIIANADATNAITIVHEAGTGTTANKIHIPGGGNMIIAPDGSVLLIYDGTLARWRVIDAN